MTESTAEKSLRQERTNTYLLIVLAAAVLRSWWLQETSNFAVPSNDYIFTKWDDAVFGGERQYVVYQLPGESDEEFSERVVLKTLQMKQRLEKGK